MTLTPGTRITLRDEDFFVWKVEPNDDHSQLLHAEGITELVKGQRFIFDTGLEDEIKVISPLQTRLLPDTSNGYAQTKLYIETALRTAAIHSPDITIAHKAAINPSDYQFEPTRKALSLPRPRILIADGVGMGKTIEVGIFLAEMIKRQQGQRILVIALKSILAQFQQEIWARFAIPLVRLDSHGIARIKADIPANKNPFDYYDKTIISIDTLKNDAKFRNYLEKTHWDIICIDECHIVANSGSQRNKLAEELASRCDALVLTSATPHNGNPDSFANLIRMLEPTAIPMDGSYGKADVAPYYLRRFKHDVDRDTQANFQEREIRRRRFQMGPEEEAFLAWQQEFKDDELGAEKQRKGATLFSITLFKAFLSSPEAAAGSIRRRIDKVKEYKSLSEQDKAQALTNLRQGLSLVNQVLEVRADSKFRQLVAELKAIGFDGKKDLRVIVFAERVETLKALDAKLKKEFKLKEEAVTLFSGQETDTKQQELVEQFGKKDVPVRLFLSSNAGAEGVNLHFQCHHMFNYDIPWSVIKLDQRNGRIDRYGQEKTPIIYYLLADSQQDGLRTDLHIVEKLIEKEEQVYASLGDAGAVFREWDPDKEEAIVEHAVATGDESGMDVAAPADDAGGDWFADLFGDADDAGTPGAGSPPGAPPAVAPTFYAGDMDYYQSLISAIRMEDPEIARQIELGSETLIEVAHSPELSKVLYDIPREAFPPQNQNFLLSILPDTVQDSIKKARKEQGKWPAIQPLYDLHPIMRWLMNKFLARQEKGSAPVAKVATLPPGTAWYAFHGIFSNELGQPLISELFLFGHNLADGGYRRHLTFDEFLKYYKLNESLINYEIGEEDLALLEEYKEDAISNAHMMHLGRIKDSLVAKMEAQYAVYQQDLDRWYQRSHAQTELKFASGEKPNALQLRKKEKLDRRANILLDETKTFYGNLTSLSGAEEGEGSESGAFLKLMAVFYNHS